MRPCIVIPHFDHVEQFSAMLPGLAGQQLPLLIVDDHSPAVAFARMKAAAVSAIPEAMIIRLDVNQGKGGAVRAGLRAAQEAGFSHAVQVDADGQHDLNGIAALLEEAQRYPQHIICGRPVFDRNIPALRYYARYLTLSLSWLESLSLEIQDAMCGFRAYPLDLTVGICESARLGSRMDFDPEILVRAVWAGIGLRYVPVRVAYPESGASHFHYFRDNVLITWMHTRLVTGMLLRLPALLSRKWRMRRTS